MRCLGDSLDASLTYRFEPFPGCWCGWCAIIADAGPRTVGCGCIACACHPARNVPDHYLRVCPVHGHRWTIDRDEPDPCPVCEVNISLARITQAIHQFRGGPHA